MPNRIFIAGLVPSSKNGRRVFGTRIVNSKRFVEWMRDIGTQMWEKRDLFREMLVGIDPPYNIEFTFVKTTRANYDYNNASQAIHDAMKNYSWITDDNVFIIKPFFRDTIYDKANPGVYIEVFRHKPMPEINPRNIRERVIGIRDLIRADNKEAAEEMLKQLYNKFL